MQDLLAGSAKVKAFDPVAMHEAQKLFENQPIQYCSTLAETVQDVDVVLLLTRWADFKALPDLLPEGANSPLVIDGRRMLNKGAFPRYEGIGL